MGFWFLSANLPLATVGCRKVHLMLYEVLIKYLTKYQVCMKCQGKKILYKVYLENQFKVRPDDDKKLCTEYMGINLNLVMYFSKIFLHKFPIKG